MINTAAGVILLDSDCDEVLLLQRPDGSWGLPGGKAEPGETLGQTACRELLEETGFDVGLSSITPVRSVYNDDGYVFTCYKATVPKFEPVLQDAEHIAWGWFPLDKLPAPLFMSTGELVLGTQVATMDKAITDGNGWREYPDNPISKVGVFPYLGRQIDESLEAEKIYYVLRPEEELSRQETIDSFKLVPWIAGHTMLGKVPTGKAAESVGISGVIGEKVYYKDGTLYGNLKVFSDGHADLISQGIKDLSLGYLSRYENSPGTYEGQAYDFVQRDIRGNHLATVQNGRMGPTVAVLDSLTFNLEHEKMADENKETKYTGAALPDINSLSVDQLIELAKPLMAKIKELGGTLQEIAAPAPATEPATDTDEEVKTKDEDEEVKVVATEDSFKAVLQAIGKRDALAKAMTPLVGVFDHAEMTLRDVAAYGCKKLGLEVAKGSEEAALRGYIAAIAKAPSASVTLRPVADSAVDEVPAFLAKHV